MPTTYVRFAYQVYCSIYLMVAASLWGTTFFPHSSLPTYITATTSTLGRAHIVWISFIYGPEGLHRR